MMDSAGKITGGGKDANGNYSLTGHCELSGLIKIEKKYVGSNTIIYKGKLDERASIKGTWAGEKNEGGAFELKSTDPQWNGYTMQGKSKVRNKFTMFLVEQKGIVYGHGHDATGCYAVVGKVEGNEWSLDKTYFGKHKVNFKGTATTVKANVSMEGKWSADGGKAWDYFQLQNH